MYKKILDWYVAINAGENPSDKDWFEEYFKFGIVASGKSQLYIKKVYPSTEKGVCRWNTQVRKFENYNEFLTITKSGRVISVPTLFNTFIDILSSKKDNISETNLDNLSGIIGLLDIYSELSEAEKGCLYRVFDDKESVLSFFREDITSDFNKPEGDIEITSDIYKEFIDKINCLLNSIIQEVKKIPSSNTDVVFPDDDENPNQDKVEKGTTDQNQSKVPFETLNTVNEGVWNQSFINSTIPPYVPEGTNPLILKISAILNLLRNKGIMIRGQYISNPGDYSADLQSMKIFNQFGDTILYTENNKLIFCRDGITTEFSLGSNTKAA